MKTENGAWQEKPLTGSSKLFLFLCAGGTILLGYAVSLAFILILLCLVACEFVIMLVLARIGAARLITGTLGSHLALLVVFFRSFWLRKGVEYRIQLAPEDAPQLFETVKTLCQKAQVAMPQEISVQLGVTAWVRLDGYRRGAGRTVLGLGFDLMAGLSRWELEGVLAHEITHAKLVQRGYKKWLNRGLMRMGQLAGGLNAHVETLRRGNQTVEPAPILFHAIDCITRNAARFVAGCSRQDEFDADRGAAVLCGAAAIRSSLVKLEPLAQHSARIPWNERVARLQSGQGFAQWFVAELASADFKRAEKAKPELFFKYSTHPSLADRLAALPESTDATAHDSTPAIFLLQEPDKAAETLIAEIQKKSAEEERKDSRRLRRFVRGGIHARLRPLQSVGVLLVLVGTIVGLLAWLVVGFSLGLACFIAGTVGAGIAGYRLGRYRDRVPLPIPDFAALKAAWQKKPDVSEARVKAIETEVQGQAARLGGSAREKQFVKLSYEALAQCDYLRAHVAARFALQVNKKSVEAALSLAVASAVLGQVSQVRQLLHFIQKTTGMSAPSTNWGAGWALVMTGDWAPAEAFLEKACRQKLDRPAVLLLRALCQSNRGKQQSALELAHQACAMRPAHKEHEKFLVDLLLNAGYLREADKKLALLKPFAHEDIEIMLSMVRWNLLSRNFAAADEWVERMKNKQIGAHLFVNLGQYFEVARQDQKAAAFFQQSLVAGFYPKSLLGLARLEAKEQKRDEARKLLLAALDTERTLGEKAVGPLPLFHQITGQMLFLEEPVIGCRAWIASLNGGKSPKALANKSILIYAPARQGAEQYLNDLMSAMEPSLPPIANAHIGWTEAKKEQQPDGPVRPGIQCVLN